MNVAIRNKLPWPSLGSTRPMHRCLSREGASRGTSCDHCPPLNGRSKSLSKDRVLSSPAPSRTLALRCGRGHYAGDLAEDRADAGGYVGHDSARGNCHEACHQCILNEVLALSIFPDFHLQNKAVDPCHRYSGSSLRRSEEH